VNKTLDSVDNNLADILMDMLRDSKKEIIVISQHEHQQLASRLEQKLGSIYADYEDDCNLLDLDEKSQELVLKRTVDCQGTKVLLEALVGKDPPYIIKQLGNLPLLRLEYRVFLYNYNQIFNILQKHNIIGYFRYVNFY
jgi:hypothetical protein